MSGLLAFQNEPVMQKCTQQNMWGICKQSYPKLLEKYLILNSHHAFKERTENVSWGRMCLVAVSEAPRAVASMPRAHCSAVEGDEGQHKDCMGHSCFLHLLLLVWQVPEFFLPLIYISVFLEDLSYIKSVQQQVGRRRTIDPQASRILPWLPTGLGMLSSPQCWLSSHHTKAGNTGPFGHIKQ